MTSLRSSGRAVVHARAQGFTLLEVLVAFALLGLALTLLLGAISGAARQVRSSQDASRASLYAQSLLADAGVGEPLDLGEKKGSFEGGRYRWVLRVQEYADPHVDTDAQGQPGSTQLRELVLDVQWGKESDQALQWKTLRLISGESRP